MQRSPLIHKFLQKKTIENHFSLHSIKAYLADLSDLERYLKSALGYSLEGITLYQLEDYLGTLMAEGYKPSAIRRKISAFKQFYKYLYQAALIDYNPAKHLKNPKNPKSQINPLSLEEITKLLSVCDQFDPPHDKRLKALIELAFGAGLRVTELVSMPFEAVNHLRDYTIITGKGQKERLIPLTSAIKQAINAYLPYRMYFTRQKESVFLFPSNSQEGYLTRIRFFQLIKQTALLAGFDPKVISPHIFRHSYAYLMLRGGADLESLKLLLGHQNIDTVEIYTQITKDDLHEMVQQYHPLVKEKE